MCGHGGLAHVAQDVEGTEMTNTPRMALVPVEANETMLKSGAHTNSEWLNDNAPKGESMYEAPAKGVFGTMLAASPAGGKVSKEHLRLVDETVYQYAMETTRTTTELVRAVIEALGLEIEK